MLRRCGRLLLLIMAGIALRLPAQSAPTGARRLVIAIGQEITQAVPGMSRSSAENQVTDLLFLRLGRYAGTSFGDRAAVPELAKSWTRRDPLTLAFDLDPRARWQDGRPVTSRDVVFSFTRARDPKQVPLVAPLLSEIVSVTAESDSRVVIRFARPYGEQLYDATYHVHILPEHLLAPIPADSLGTSAFARSPIGSGPYRWEKLEQGQYLQLRSMPDFFLGTPAIEQVVWRFTTSQDTRLNMLLSGEADVQEDVIPPLSNLARLSERPSLGVSRIPSMSVNYLLFNQRAPADTSRPHPILADVQVRRALAIGLDRATIAQALFGKYAQLVSSPAASAAWFSGLAPSPARFDPKEAVRLLAARGWSDSDGDGVLDRNGVPLALSLVVRASSVARMQMAVIVQEQWRKIGVKADIEPLEMAQFATRRRSGAFDVVMENVSWEPSPWSLIDRWGCHADGNYGRYCNVAADSLLRAAHLAVKDPVPPIRAWLRTIANDFPAVFVYSADRVVAMPKAYGNVNFHAESPLLMVWTWTLAGASH